MGLFGKFFGKSPSNPSKKDFAQLMADAIRAAGEKASIRYDAEEFRLEADREGNPQLLNLNNLYAEYCSAAREQREHVLKRFARSWFAVHQEVPEEFADVHPDLLPSVRNRSYYELTSLQLRVRGMPTPDWPYQPVAGHLAVSLVYDLPDSIMAIQQDRLDGWKVTFEEALEAAKANLAGISGGQFESPAPGVWQSPWKDNHDPARLVLLDLIREQRVKGDPVALIPNRDTLLLTGADDAEGLANLVALAKKAKDHPRPYTTAPVRLDGDTWLPFLPPAGHPQRAAFQMLHGEAFGQDYAEQAELLNALHEQTDEDIFVATYSGLQDKGTGAVVSYCVWSEGVDALLPRTDQIFFFRPRGENDGQVVARCDWERVQQVCGDLLEKVDMYPERYRVRGTFPSEKQLRELGAGR